MSMAPAERIARRLEGDSGKYGQKVALEPER